jgi:hypothetical protein
VVAGGGRDHAGGTLGLGEREQLGVAPRILNEPVRCWFSNFSETSQPAPVRERLRVLERRAMGDTAEVAAAARMSSTLIMGANSTLFAIGEAWVP